MKNKSFLIFSALCITICMNSAYADYVDNASESMEKAIDSVKKRKIIEATEHVSDGLSKFGAGVSQEIKEQVFGKCNDCSSTPK